MITIKQILSQALAHIQKGWTQGRSWEIRDGVDCYCAIAAIGKVESTLYNIMPMQQATQLGNDAIRVLDKFIPESEKYAGSVVNYNDDLTTTKEDVINLYKKAIDSLPDWD
jgi:hypothetical protein